MRARRLLAVVGVTAMAAIVMMAAVVLGDDDGE
jgi:hypothetical protein